MHETHLVRKKIGSSIAQLSVLVAYPQLSASDTKTHSFQLGPPAVGHVTPRITNQFQLLDWKVSHLWKGD
ncbi:hypothetical protein [Prosthecobacter sp.]|uniref:hypothetical protein n=1 Tax=Prosthecobacter sp. TaxID=1965333 RepID=UPI002ABC37D9|nr:hypothetical protein [Prosthecobacter sp.]MDZ4405298.1 hypothetical protein [Prosthecobacter sp.]